MTKTTTYGTAAGAAIGLITPHPMQMVVWAATLVVALMAVISWGLKIERQLRERNVQDDERGR